MERASLARLVMCLITLLIGVDARATGSATANISDLTVQLSDLAPDDGVAPQVTFSGYALASGWLDPLASFPTRPSPDPIQTFFQPGPTVPNAFSWSDAAMSSGNMSSRAIITATSLTATVSATGTGTAVAQAYSGSAYDPFQGLWLSLSPHTSMTISAVAAVQALSDGAVLGPFYWQFAESRADVSLNIVDLTGQHSLGGYDGLAIDTYFGPGNVDAGRTLSVTYSNTSDTVEGLGFYATAEAISTSVVSEPSPLSLIVPVIASVLYVRRRSS